MPLYSPSLFTMASVHTRFRRQDTVDQFQELLRAVGSWVSTKATGHWPYGYGPVKDKVCNIKEFREEIHL